MFEHISENSILASGDMMSIEIERRSGEEGGGVEKGWRSRRDRSVSRDATKISRWGQ